MRAVINVKCPECGGFLEIDVARQRVLSHRLPGEPEPTDQDKEKLFDEVVGRVKHRHDKADKIFDDAKRNVAENESKLDDLFGEVKKKIAEEKEKGDDPEDPRRLMWD